MTTQTHPQWLAILIEKMHSQIEACLDEDDDWYHNVENTAKAISDNIADDAGYILEQEGIEDAPYPHGDMDRSKFREILQNNVDETRFDEQFRSDTMTDDTPEWLETLVEATRTKTKRQLRNNDVYSNAEEAKESIILDAIEETEGSVDIPLYLTGDMLVEIIREEADVSDLNRFGHEQDKPFFGRDIDELHIPQEILDAHDYDDEYHQDEEIPPVVNISFEGNGQYIRQDDGSYRADDLHLEVSYISDNADGDVWESDRNKRRREKRQQSDVSGLSPELFARLFDGELLYELTHEALSTALDNASDMGTNPEDHLETHWITYVDGKADEIYGDPARLADPNYEDEEAYEEFDEFLVDVARLDDPDDLINHGISMLFRHAMRSIAPEVAEEEFDVTLYQPIPDL